MLKNICSHLGKRIKSINISQNVIENKIITQQQITVLNDKVCLILPKQFFSNENTLDIDKILNLKTDFLIHDIKEYSYKKLTGIAFNLDKNIFISDVLRVPEPDHLTLVKEKLIIEYSSPNIAKPFHVGNFRSTIIGNFLANINSHLNNSVVRLNYLGDWGTQFGFLNVGIDLLNLNAQTLAKDPINLLYKAYTCAHELSKSKPEIVDKARNIFSSLEQGDSKYLERWKLLKQYTVSDLEQTYNRIGVKFDKYDWESMYRSDDIQSIINLLNNHQLLMTDAEGRKVIPFNNRTIPILKSDNTTLYVTRDIAAAIDRYNQYKFDRMLYVVDNAQTDHFEAIKYILKRLELNWADRIVHVKFGRVRGMSTRKGTAVFLKDILDEARDRLQKQQIESPTTKVHISDDRVADILGATCVIINDLKQRRQRDYEFNWDKILQSQGDTGTKLQYTHCRLRSLEDNCGVNLPEKCEPSVLLTDREAMALVIHLSKYYSILYKSYVEMEACILVNYLFQLCNLTSKALKTLRVKNENPAIASQRLLLFTITRTVIHDCMKILGLQPLEQM